MSATTDQTHQFRPGAPSRPIPRPVGEALALAAAPPSAGDGLGRVALSLDALDRQVLDALGHHPFLATDDLATLLGMGREEALGHQTRLMEAGLLRSLAPDNGAEPPSEEVLELTATGLKLLAAQQGLSLGAAIRLNGLAGGGPDQSLGTRAMLLQQLAHTRGADRVFVHLHATQRAVGATGEDAALVEWQNAAACARRHLRPDGYGLVRWRGQYFQFFLEYDRATMKRRAYCNKFGAYYATFESGRFRREYDSFPTILVVTTDDAAEARIAGAALDALGNRLVDLPLLLTTERRLRDHPDGWLGPIWRDPRSATRRSWPPRGPDGTARAIGADAQISASEAVR